MKINAALIGILVLGLCSCSEEEAEVSEDTRPERPRYSKSNRPKSTSGSGEFRTSARTPTENSRPVTREEPREEEEKKTAYVVPRRMTNPPVPSNEELEERREEQQAQRMARMTEAILGRLQQADANGDGVLTQDELPGPMASRFADVDTNGDGSLDAEEQKAAIQSISDRISEFTRDRGGRGGGGRRGGGQRGGRGGGPGGRGE